MSIASRYAANTCQAHGKKSYTSKDLAKKAIDELHEPGMRAYRCDATTGEALWHIGHLPKAVINGTKTTAEHYEGVTFMDGSELQYGSESPLTRRLSPLDIRPRNGHKPAMENSIEALLATAEASQVAVAQKLAAQIRALLAELVNEIRYGEQERLLSDRAEHLRLELEDTLRQIERLRGEPQPDETEPEPAPAPKRGGNYGAKEDQGLIRAWGLENGWDVKPIGQLSKALRDAYAAASGGSR